MSSWRLKRFWKAAQVIEDTDGFAIALDDRRVKTPAKRPLVVPTRQMAQMIAAEWDAQEDEIKPQTMPTTRTANAALDKVAFQRAEVADLIAAYGDSDLLCYRAEHPVSLVNRQSAAWDPMLDWAEQALGVRLHLRFGIMHKAQDAHALSVLQARTHALDPFELAAFHDLVSLSGSLILGFAAAAKVRSLEELWEMSRLDEIWQADQWGRDDEAEAQAAQKKSSFLHAGLMFQLSQP
ncbi:MAG: ATP12 family protein [Pseudomonadota bacterium]